MQITLPVVEIRVFGTMLVLFINGVDARRAWTPDEADDAHRVCGNLRSEMTARVVGDAFVEENKARRCLKRSEVPWEKFIAAFPAKVQELVR